MSAASLDEGAKGAKGGGGGGEACGACVVFLDEDEDGVEFDIDNNCLVKVNVGGKV